MPEFSIGRTLSLIIVAGYIVIAALGSSEGKLVTDLLIVAAGLVFPLTCIWFADELGEYVGTLPGPAINRKSPAWMVRIGGWVLLLLPLLFFWLR
jgi:hypothetical protein